jgi:hypothetical protein
MADSDTTDATGDQPRPVTLTEDDFARAAQTLSCEVACVKAVCAVEAPRGGFLPDGRPTILFERHIFSRLTNHLYDSAHPDISNRSPGGYGAGGAHQYDRLLEAEALDAEAAIQSASWGKFQIMGENFRACGYDTPDDFVAAMSADEGLQLDAFVKFVQSEHLDGFLRAKNWAAFARGYNGPNYLENDYANKLARNYAANRG